MDLKDFVSNTLLSIVAGVSEAQNQVSAHGALVNPAGLMRNKSNISNNTVWDNRTNVYAQPVSFDVAVTAEDTAAGGARIKVLSGILGGDIGGEKGSKNVIASRVQFVVPVLLPSQDIGDPAARTVAGGRKVVDKGVR